MSTKAYILIETKVGKSRSARESIDLLPDVVSVDAITGPYDLIAIAEKDTLEGINTLVSEHIHSIEGIVRTVTCISLNGVHGH